MLAICFTKSANFENWVLEWSPFFGRRTRKLITRRPVEIIFVGKVERRLNHELLTYYQPYRSMCEHGGNLYMVCRTSAHKAKIVKFRLTID